MLAWFYLAGVYVHVEIFRFLIAMIFLNYKAIYTVLCRKTNLCVW